jgi:hypothetical protein
MSIVTQSPIYYAAMALHPRYKTYFKRFWRNKPTQLSTAHAKFLQVWAAYKPAAAATTPTPAPKPNMSSFDNAINAILDEDSEHTMEVEDEYDSWLKEPMWTSDQHKEGPTAVQYWLSLKLKYPNLSQLAIDVLTIPPLALIVSAFFRELTIYLSQKGGKLVRSYWLLWCACNGGLVQVLQPQA